jgi:6-pyruvoyltetrahydropterin/6-carboxytetrahydropterin synthase
MIMKIAKEFSWEMGHRLTFHKGKCRNIHGHSYKMMIEFTGKTDEDGMVFDYYDVKDKIQPLVDELDHAFMVKEDDVDLLDFLKKNSYLHVIVDFESTAENIAVYFLKKIKDLDLPENITKVKVKILETENTYAEDEIELK